MILVAQLVLITLLIGVVVWQALHTSGTHQEAMMQLLAAFDVERGEHRAMLVELERQHAQERRAAHPDLTELVALVDRVCQRLQAPEHAVVSHEISDHPSPPAVNPDDDEAYWDARSHIDKSELADLAMEAELSG